MPLLQMLGSHRTGGPALYSVGAVLNNGRYRIDKKLNKGATAIVYAATDKQTGRQVALKVVQCGTNKVPVNVVRREVTLSSSVAHENMVQLLDVFAEGTELIIVWELIAGPDLLELLNEAQGRMNEPAAAFYFVQLLRGVLHMHAMGYCHRDIKPENCMVERSTQRLKLIDFGLSKHLESVATLGVGTPDYMPPEMVRSQMKQQQRQQQQQQQRQVGSGAPMYSGGGSGRLPPHPLAAVQNQPPPYDAKKVDAWAMGVVLYLLVTGTYPFEDPAQPNNLAATIMNVQAGRCRPLPPHISSGCRGVIAGLLNPEPDQRTSLEDLAYSPWVLENAAAHAAQLGALASRFDCSNPAWILPTNYTSAAPPEAAAAAPEPAGSVRHTLTGSSAGSSAVGGSSSNHVTGSSVQGSPLMNTRTSSAVSAVNVQQQQPQQQYNPPAAAAAATKPAVNFHPGQQQQWSHSQMQKAPTAAATARSASPVAAADQRRTAAAAGGARITTPSQDGSRSTSSRDDMMDIDDDSSQGTAAAAAGPYGAGNQAAAAAAAAAARNGGGVHHGGGDGRHGKRSWLPSFMKKFR